MREGSSVSAPQTWALSSLDTATLPEKKGNPRLLDDMIIYLWFIWFLSVCCAFAVVHAGSKNFLKLFIDSL